MLRVKFGPKSCVLTTCHYITFRDDAVLLDIIKGSNFLLYCGIKVKIEPHHYLKLANYAGLA